MEISTAIYLELFKLFVRSISLSSDLASKIVVAPSSDIFLAVASPIPFEAPHISAVLPFKLKIMNTSKLHKFSIIISVSESLL